MILPLKIEINLIYLIRKDLIKRSLSDTDSDKVQLQRELVKSANQNRPREDADIPHKKIQK